MLAPPWFWVHVLFWSGPALALGYVKFTVTVTASTLMQPVILLVAVSIYVVVTLGLANGLELFAGVRSFVGFHE